jgi:hypothetical protein
MNELCTTEVARDEFVQGAAEKKYHVERVDVVRITTTRYDMRLNKTWAMAHWQVRAEVKGLNASGLERFRQIEASAESLAGAVAQAVAVLDESW